MTTTPKTPETQAANAPLDELRRRKRIISEPETDSRVEQQHARGKLTARERIGHLLDKAPSRNSARS